MMNQAIAKRKATAKRALGPKILLMLLGLSAGLIFLFPIYWLFMNSFKSDMEILTSITFWPRTFTIEPWREQLTSSDFFCSLRNSLSIAVLAMSLSVTLGVPAAYGMSRYRMRGRSAILLMFLVSQMLPSSLLLTPLFLTFSKLNLLNTYLAPAMAVAAGSIPFIVVTLRPFFLSLPQSLVDAARIDGCNEFKSFLLIMVPVIRSGLITIFALTFLHGWNDLAYSMTFNIRESMRPLTANIHKYMDKYGIRWNYIMAYGMILVVPVVLMFIFIQRYIVDGMAAGAVKE